MPPDSVPCPGCGLPMGLEEELCPHCRRPRDEREIERGKQDILDEEARRRRLPKLVALRLAGFFALAGLFLSRHAIYRAATYLTHRGGAEIERYTDPDFVAGRTPRAETVVPDASPAPSEAPLSTAAVQPSTPRLVFVAAHKAAAAPPPPPAAPAPAPPAPIPPHKAVAPPVPRAPGTTNWLFYGVVFDMATGFPITHAKVVVRHEGQESGVSAFTDEDGFYRVYTPRGMGGDSFIVEASASGYRDGQVEDREPTWREASDEARVSAMGELMGHDLDPVPRTPADGDGLVSLDLLLLPATKKAAAR